MSSMIDMASMSGMADIGNVGLASQVYLSR